MKKLTLVFVLTVLIVSLSGCIFSNDDASCNKNVSNKVDHTGILYKTTCKELGTSKYGLINTNFDLVISETYTIIDRGFTIQHQGYDNIEFEEEVAYFRTLFQDGSDLKQGVINRKGEDIIKAEAYDDVLISRNQEFIYLYNGSGQIYHIETKKYEPVDYRIVKTMGDYYIADVDDSYIVLDDDFNIVHGEYYNQILFVSNDWFIYEKENLVFSKDSQTNRVVELFDTIEYPSYSLHEDWSDYILVNPNSKDMFFVNSQSGEQTYIEGCSRILDYHQDTFSMICDTSHQVFSKDTLALELEIPKTNTEILDTYPIYFAYGDEETSLHSIGETITFDSAYESHKVLYGELLQVTTSERFLYNDLQTFKKLYETDKACMFLLNDYRTDFLFHQGDCNIYDRAETLTVISLENSSLRNGFILEFKYYTEDLLFFVKDGNTVITDYELNVLYK